MTLKDLPDIDLINFNADDIQEEVFSLYSQITGRNLAQGDPVRLFLNFITNYIILLKNQL